MTVLQINELFTSIQGEGRYAGHPAVFVRLSGCNLNCKWCDTKRHVNANLELSPERLADYIERTGLDIVVWTGGEPMVQMLEMRRTIALLEKKKPGIKHHLETNCTIVRIETFNKNFSYIAFSPKKLQDAKEIIKIKDQLTVEYDIKVVSDFQDVGIKMLKFATMLMPLTTFNEDLDDQTRKIAWMWCVRNKKLFCLRQQIVVWGNLPNK